jgi:hypothetical protein
VKGHGRLPAETERVRVGSHPEKTLEVRPLADS